MDLLVRFFYHLENKVKIHYFDSRFFGHGTHKDLVKQFHDGMKDLDPNKIVPDIHGWSKCEHEVSGRNIKRTKG